MTMDAKQQVNEILAANGVAMTAQHVPTTFDPRSKEWQHIAWRVEFSSPRGKFSTSYKQGIGHLPAGMVPQGGRYTIDQLERIKFALSTGMVPHKNCNANLGAASMRYGAKPLAKPDAADVVSSLILDAGAADYATFEEWAGDYGYETDSRKAEAIFNACRNTALDLIRVFGAGVVEQLKPIAQEM
jgi:hypothetical protein